MAAVAISWTELMDMTEDVHEHAAFACCSAGIGRWFWVAWASESDARALAPGVASGFEKSADAARKKAVEAVGPEMKQLPAKWASGFRGRGSLAARTGEDLASEGRPKSRLSRPIGTAGKQPGPIRLAFLYFASEGDLRGEVAVARHRIVRQNRTKIHVERNPFREEEWTSREEAGPDAPKPRTLAVDRDALRREGKVAYRGAFFYASEEDGIRDVHAALTSKHAWCASLGVKFPCSPQSVKAAYRRLARTLHPDAGGDPAEFRTLEQAYRDALAYLAPVDGTTARPAQEAGDAPSVPRVGTQGPIGPENP